MEKKPPLPQAATLQYDQARQAVPKVTARGKGVLAERIIALALANGIPQHRDADLVEVLTKLDLDEDIPLPVYATVAEIFAYLYRFNAQQGNPHGK
mgnify:FL=1